jgi:hypothetical protein
MVTPTESLGRFLKKVLSDEKARKELENWLGQDLQITSLETGDGGFTINYLENGQKKALKVDQD